MTPEQFVVWLREFLEGSDKIGIQVLADSHPGKSVRVYLSAVVLKTQPPQPGVPGVLGQGLMKLERPNRQVQLDTSEVPVFRDGGCQ